MALEQLDFTGFNKVEFAMEVLKSWEPPEGYYFADSGGKDSSVVRDLLIKSGVKFDAHYCVSPIDPPQIRDFLKQHHPDTQWDYHARGFWKLVVEKGLPLRHGRWCCQVIKEAGGDNRVVVVGNRNAEGGSIRRNQCFIETIQDRRKKGYRKSGKTFIRPIIFFSNYDVWQYIREYNVPYCYLYDEGANRKSYGEGLFKRLGCVLCPFSRNVSIEEKYFPELVKLWKLSCNHIVENAKARGYLTKRGKPLKHKFETGEELYKWWKEIA